MSGEGHRVEQQVGQFSCGQACGMTYTTTQYVAGGIEEVAQEGGTSPSTTTTHYYSAGGLLVGERVNGTLSYLASDGLGSVSAALSSSGSLTAAQLFAPYGGVRYASGTMPTARGYTGQYADAATGLDYFKARYYDPIAGQFTTADSVKGGQGPNRYGYVLGNPETHTDPTGQTVSCPPPGGCGGGGGGGGNPPPVKHATCDQTCQLTHQIRNVFQDPRTQAVMLMLLNSGAGVQFVEFLLAAGKLFGGDNYISWDLTNPSEGGYTTFSGHIQLNPALLTQYGKDPAGALGGLISAAGALVHEAVESYYAIEYDVRSQASQHMDYVAEWFAGEVKGQLAAQFNTQMPGGSAYLLTFAQWRETPDGQAYASEPVNQPEAASLLSSAVAIVAGSRLFGAPPNLPDSMGLTYGMLTSPGLVGSGPQNVVEPGSTIA